MTGKRSLNVFVSMPFHQSFDEVYIEAISPLRVAFPGWMLNINRADTMSPTAERLGGHIGALLSNCDAVIADITGNNPNVMFELGLAQGLQRSIILITQDAHAPSTLSDVLRVWYSRAALNDLRNALIVSVTPLLPAIVAKQAMATPMGPGRRIWVDPAARSHRDGIPTSAREARDLGNAAKDRGELELAVDHYRQAVNQVPEYWEATYELATVLSRLKREEEAVELAERARAEAFRGRDFEFVFKAYNLIAGIREREGNHSECLSNSRHAYFYSHLWNVVGKGRVPHIVPMKNLCAYEYLYGNQESFRALLCELSAHPDFRDIRGSLEEDIGPIEEK